MGFWVARNLVQYENNLKRQFLLAEYFMTSETALMEPIQKKRSFGQTFLYDLKSGSWCLSFPLKARKVLAL